VLLQRLLKLERRLLLALQAARPVKVGRKMVALSNGLRIVFYKFLAVEGGAFRVLFLPTGCWLIIGGRLFELSSAVCKEAERILREAHA